MEWCLSISVSTAVYGVNIEAQSWREQMLGGKGEEKNGWQSLFASKMQMPSRSGRIGDLGWFPSVSRSSLTGKAPERMLVNLEGACIPLAPW